MSDTPRPTPEDDASSAPVAHERLELSARGVWRALRARLRGDTSGARIARGALWSVAGSVGSRGLNLVTFLFVARWLGAERFGEFGIVRSTAEMFGLFAGFGMGLTATKHVAQYRAGSPERAGRILGLTFLVAIVLGVLATALLWLAAPALTASVLDAPHLEGELRLGALLVLLGALSGVATGGLAGLEAFRQIAICNALGALLGLPFILVGAHLHGVAGATGGFVLSAGIQLVIVVVALRRRLATEKLALSFRGLRRERGLILSFSVPAFLGQALTGPASWAALALLVRHGGGYGEVGHYAAANQWFSALILVPMLVGGAALPVLAQAVELGRLGDARHTMRRLMQVNLVFTVPAALVLGLLSPLIMALYGGSFVEHWPTLVLCVASVCVFAAQQPAGHLIVASGRMWLGFGLNGIWACVFIVGTLAFATMGSSGLALARLVAYGVHLVLSLVLVQRVLRS